MSIEWAQARHRTWQSGMSRPPQTEASSWDQLIMAMWGVGPSVTKPLATLNEENKSGEANCATEN